MTSFSGVTFASLTSPIGWMMWKPNSVFTGREISFFFNRNAVWSNGATVWPFEIVNLPPFAFEPVSSENFFASAAKSAPAFSWL